MSLISHPASLAGLVTREVRTGSRDGVATRVAVARRTYPTDRDDLWDALTSAERLPRWFLPVSGDLEVGGRYQLEGNAGGLVERCDRPSSFAVTWEYGEMVSWVEVRLLPDGDGTALELLHEAPVDPEMWEQFGPGAVGVGWDLALMGLGVHLETREAVDPEAGASFALTPEGTEFVRTAAAGWSEAAAADGDDPAVAAAAAERTVALYTTGPEGGTPEDGADR
ncbi:SRPBCC family protein [Nocardioides sp. TF02-7]|uniref:SRPBCC family protein n=1 Tax=Nocardioides sp. TF02-7 TaxID=2917724 RepID=UPI001F0701B3|nr:SRPBCC family protein [Nocardioides sp. TF02-7]UMG92531.1 SRPBCC family protein [Nocardioides sp. TF02-7]